jgi:tetratricopeptide (TPR) repeat protein
LEAGLALFRLLSDEASVGRCLNILGKLALRTDDFAKAEPLLYESLTLSLAHGSSEAIALSLYTLGGVMRAQGKYRDAETYYRQSLALYQELELAVGIGTMLYNVGFSLNGQRNYADAFEYFLDALKVLQPLDEQIAVAECFIGLAGAYFHREQPEMATRVLSAARAILTSLNAEGELSSFDRAEYDRIYAALKSDDPHWQADWARGQSTSWEQMIKNIFREV